MTFFWNQNEAKKFLSSGKHYYYCSISILSIINIVMTNIALGVTHKGAQQDARASLAGVPGLRLVQTLVCDGHDLL
jgi:hypothetical protein